MGGGEGRDRPEQAPAIADQQQQREDEQQVVDALENVRHPEADIAAEDLQPARLSRDGEGRLGGGQAVDPRRARFQLVTHQHVGPGPLQPRDLDHAAGQALGAVGHPGARPGASVEDRCRRLVGTGLRQAGLEGHRTTAHVRHPPGHPPAVLVERHQVQIAGIEGMRRGRDRQRGHEKQQRHQEMSHCPSTSAASGVVTA